MLRVLKRAAGRQHFPLRRAVRTEARFQPSFDPFTYTKGRWLDRDKDRRDARRLHFDFDALLEVAVRCSPGARRVTHCEKREGGFNRVFMIHLDNKSTVVARLPTSIAGPPSLTTSSEVATLQYVKQRTKIPVPNVFAWSAESENSIGAEYMILDAIPGVPLKDVWNSMTASQHVACIRSIGGLCKQLCQLTFPVYGSLYLNSEAPPGVVRLDEVFCIGPVCGSQHWNRTIDSATGAKHPGHLQGPWRNVQDYFSDHIARGRASPQTPAPHSEVLDKLEQSLRLLATSESIEKASGPTLFHPDLHTRNIFVDAEDHTKITGLIDWQSAAVEPAFVFAAEAPDFAEDISDEENSKDSTAEEQASNTKLRADTDFCVKTWAVMQQTCEKLRPASRLDPTLLRVLAAPSFGWIDSNIIIELLLNDLAEQWEQLGFPGQSIHQLSSAEDVVQRLDEYQAKRQLQDHLTRLLRCDNDGWVTNDRWEEVLPRYRLEYNRFVESVVNSEQCKTEKEEAMAVAKANRLWPYDQR